MDSVFRWAYNSFKLFFKRSVAIGAVHKYARYS